ncbi:hypothetical protein BKA64DRAFT_144261 [Cadophora sp. MPI-SDFR-AT-0126]|nr:hypothetical protein BKA64DRAFT_144261 [Leotiomycetes sp. MPI-SDFR-AT-0126]
MRNAVPLFDHLNLLLKQSILIFVSLFSISTLDMRHFHVFHLRGAITKDKLCRIRGLNQLDQVGQGHSLDVNTRWSNGKDPRTARSGHLRQLAGARNTKTSILPILTFDLPFSRKISSFATFVVHFGHFCFYFPARDVSRIYRTGKFCRWGRG